MFFTFPSIDWIPQALKVEFRLIGPVVLLRWCLVQLLKHQHGILCTLLNFQHIVGHIGQPKIYLCFVPRLIDRCIQRQAHSDTAVFQKHPANRLCVELNNFFRFHKHRLPRIQRILRNGFSVLIHSARPQIIPDPRDAGFVTMINRSLIRSVRRSVCQKGTDIMIYKYHSQHLSFIGELIIPHFAQNASVILHDFPALSTFFSAHHKRFRSSQTHGRRPTKP